MEEKKRESDFGAIGGRCGGRGVNSGWPSMAVTDEGPKTTKENDKIKRDVARSNENMANGNILYIEIQRVKYRKGHDAHIRY